MSKMQNAQRVARHEKVLVGGDDKHQVRYRSQTMLPDVTDQLEMVSKKQMRPILRQRQEIEAALENRKVF